VPSACQVFRSSPERLAGAVREVAEGVFEVFVAEVRRVRQKATRMSISQ